MEVTHDTPAGGTSNNQVVKRNQSDDSAVADYRRRLAELTASVAADRRTDHRFGFVRVGLFLASIIIGVVAISEASLPTLAAAAALFVAFLIVITLNETPRRRIAAAKSRRRLLKRLIARVDHDWKALDRYLGDDGTASMPLDDRQRAAAGDLDLLGVGSLHHRISTASTKLGSVTLADWLVSPCLHASATDRAELRRNATGRRDSRLAFYETAASIAQTAGSPDQLLRWMTGKPFFQTRPLLKVLPSVMLAAFAIALVATIVGVVSGLPPVRDAGLIAMGVVLVINLIVTMTMMAPVHEAIKVALTGRDTTDAYRQLFLAADWITAGSRATAEGSSDRTRDGLASQIHTASLDPDVGAVAAMDALTVIARMNAPRSSALLFLLYVPMQLIGLYDLWLMRRLETWRIRYRDHAESWFDALGAMEAILSVAAVADEQPDWCDPQLDRPDDDDAAIRASRIGHPLITADDRVCNDVTLGPRNSVLLVTGSNMSGKSTLLRSIGLNVSLTAAGSPVCATSMSLPPCELLTSIRVTDDLSGGVSFYMAELKRLKQVVARAEQLRDSTDRVALVLLDEILRGTNSRERQIAVARVLRRLMDVGALGAITTHDLELTGDDVLAAHAVNVHFRETIDVGEGDAEDQMTFDYTLRDGVCPTTNALKLLEMVGL